MEEFEKRLRLEKEKVAANNQHGYGYLPFLLSQKFGRFTSATKELQQDFPLFDGIVNCNNGMDVIIIYDKKEIVYVLQNE